MRKLVVAALFTLLAAPAELCAAETASISALYGKVEMKTAKDADWTPAAEGALLEEGGSVRTGSDGRALLVFANKSKVWMKESSAMEISSLQARDTALNVSLGSVKIRVPHLRLSEKFNVKTQAAIAAVRGTELTLGYDESGQTMMEVLYGLVKMNYLNPPPGVDPVDYVSQGIAFVLDQQGMPKKELMSREQEIKALEDWHPGYTQEQRVGHLIAKAQDRQELRNYARDSNRTDQMVQNLVTNVREADIEAGRTLNDVHGNLVRVDQRLLRPDNSSLQIINLVKRPVYNYGYGHYAYNGGQVVNRLDSMQARVEFNMTLPQNLEDWPGFFKDNKSALHPNYAMMVVANQTNRGEIFAIADKAVYNSSKDELDDGGLIYFGTFTGSQLPGGDDAYTQFAKFANGGNLARMSDGAVKVNGSPIDGLVWAQKDQSSHLSYDSDNGKLYNYMGDLYYIGNDTLDPTKRVWLATEAMVISNGGQIKNTTDITSSGKDPFTIAKESGGEIMFYMKKDQGGQGFNQIASYDYNSVNIGGLSYQTNPGSRNIDLVVVPDLALAVVQRMLPTLDKIKK